MLLKQFPTCVLAFGGDRVALGAAKVKELGRQAALLSSVVLDDGLQQWRLEKDLEIVMVDALHPLGNGLLLPCESLREKPRDAFARADIVILHHANLLDEEHIQYLMENIRKLMDPRKNSLVATSKLQVTGLISAARLLPNAMMNGTSSDVATGKDKQCLTNLSVLVICGGGNPESVKLVVENWTSWVRLEVIAFPDHHGFTQDDVHEIVERLQEFPDQGSAVVVTTEKDFARSPIAMEIRAKKADLRVLECELELLQHSHQVKQRIDVCLNQTSGKGHEQ